jgi:hypothetical protein
MELMGLQVGLAGPGAPELRSIVFRELMGLGLSVVFVAVMEPAVFQETPERMELLPAAAAGPVKDTVVVEQLGALVERVGSLLKSLMKVSHGTNKSSIQRFSRTHHRSVGRKSWEYSFSGFLR